VQEKIRDRVPDFHGGTTLSSQTLQTKNIQRTVAQIWEIAQTSNGKVHQDKSAELNEQFSAEVSCAKIYSHRFVSRVFPFGKSPLIPVVCSLLF
jgi:hypothetical protein